MLESFRKTSLLKQNACIAFDFPFAQFDLTDSERDYTTVQVDVNDLSLKTSVFGKSLSRVDI